jgi:hypothetical protein
VGVKNNTREYLNTIKYEFEVLSFILLKIGMCIPELDFWEVSRREKCSSVLMLEITTGSRPNYLKGISKFAFITSIRKYENKTEIVTKIQFYFIIKAKITNF